MDKPFFQGGAMNLNNLAWAYALSEQYEQAILLWQKTLQSNPDPISVNLYTLTIIQANC